MTTTNQTDSRNAMVSLDNFAAAAVADWSYDLANVRARMLDLAQVAVTPEQYFEVRALAERAGRLARQIETATR